MSAPTECSTCRYYDDRFAIARCRRRPPVADAFGTGLQPSVGANDWCGEYVPDPVRRNKAGNTDG